MNPQIFSPIVRSYLIIGLIVCAVHLFLVLGMTLSLSESPQKPKKQQQLLVRTVPLSPKVQQISVEPMNSMLVAAQIKPKDEPIQKEESIPKKEEPIKKVEVPKQSNPPKPVETKKAESVPPKKQPPKVHPKKEEKEKPKPANKSVEAKKEFKKQAEKKSEPKKKIESLPILPPSPPKLSAEEIAAQEAAKTAKKELLAQAQKSLAGVGQVREKEKSANTKMSGVEQASIPSSIGSLQIEALPQLAQGEEALTAREISYRDEVAMRLKMALKLPDYGEVKVKLILSRTGKVEFVQVLASESEKNRQYVEKTLPSMKFLPFENRFNGAPQYSFIVKLHNE